MGRAYGCMVEVAVSGLVVASVAPLAMARTALADSTAAADVVRPSTSGVENPEAFGEDPLRGQRARLVMDQTRRGDAIRQRGRALPVRGDLADLLPQHGLRRGSTVVVRGSTSLLLALLADATAEGSWAAVVGMPDLGLLAAAELGVTVSRLALVPRPGAELGAVVAALLDGMDLVVVAADQANRQQVRSRTPALAKRLSARARYRESVLVSFGTWPGADLELDGTRARWSGLGDGAGHLTEHELTITVRGRGAATRPTQGRIALPGHPTGKRETAPRPAIPFPGRTDDATAGDLRTVEAG